jgi:hypothetical protein
MESDTKIDDVIRDVLAAQARGGADKNMVDEVIAELVDAAKHDTDAKHETHKRLREDDVIVHGNWTKDETDHLVQLVIRQYHDSEEDVRKFKRRYNDVHTSQLSSYGRSSADAIRLKLCRPEAIFGIAHAATLRERERSCVALSALRGRVQSERAKAAKLQEDVRTANDENARLRSELDVTKRLVVQSPARVRTRSETNAARTDDGQ